MCKTAREYYELSKREYKCKKCGKLFKASSWCRDKKTGKGNDYCSIKCSKLKIEPIECVGCGKIFKPKQLHRYNRVRKYCSKECCAKDRGRIYKGDRIYNWLGGQTYRDYPREFNKELKEVIRKRDGYRCQQCFRHQSELFLNTKAGIRPRKPYVHHIDYDKTNNNESNLVSLCLTCHAQTNYKRGDWTNYFKQKLCQL